MVKKYTFTLVVDNEDADLINNFNVRSSQNLAREIAKRFLGPKPDGYHVDHIDDDWKNNRRNNLQYLPARENMRKKNKNSSKFYGVTIRPARGRNTTERYEAVLSINAESVYIGIYREEVDAAYAVDNYLRSINKPAVNFPDVFATPVRTTRGDGISLGGGKIKNRTGYVGVTETAYGKFYFEVTVNKKVHHSKPFLTAIEAAKGRDKYIHDNNINRKFNFPEDYGL